MEKLGVRMHDVTLTLETDHEPLLAYAKEHLNSLVETPVDNPNLYVKCLWSEGEWDPEANPFPSNGHLNVIGKRMLGSQDELIWLNTIRTKGLQLRFRKEESSWIFDVSYCFHPKKNKLDNLKDYQYKRYFSLMSYLVYYPLIWYLENFRSQTFFHASALATAKGGIMVGGLGGVGKTTTCVALMQQDGVRLISENIILTDGESVYPCQEPIRLNPDSLEMLGHEPAGLVPMAFPDGLKDKSMFHLQTDDLPSQVKPKLLFFPQFSSEPYLKPLSAEAAAEKMVAMNRLTRELDDYSWYAAALDMHWPNPGLAEKRIHILQNFAKQGRCFELGIDRSAGVEAVIKDILGCLEKN